jgi:hypothetical protein
MTARLAERRYHQALSFEGTNRDLVGTDPRSRAREQHTNSVHFSGVHGPLLLPGRRPARRRAA